MSRRNTTVNAYLRGRAQAIGLARTARPMLDELQLGFLHDLALLAPAGDGLEIGTYFGSSLVCWGMARRGMGGLTVIDPFTAKAKQRAVFDEFMRLADLAPTVLVGSSADPAIIAAIPPALAFAFIDGDHTADGVRSDITTVYRRILPGGVIAFHDYTTVHGESAVINEVDAWQVEAGWEDLGLVSSLKAFRRPA